MKEICHKCGTELDSDLGSIICIIPAIHRGKMHQFILCRTHFIESDKMNHDEFWKWMHPKERDSLPSLLRLVNQSAETPK